MTIVIVPTKRCNLGCAYCFEPESMRRTDPECALDVEGIARSLDEVWSGPWQGGMVGLHGGECTLLDLPDLENLLALTYEKTGRSGVQTHGYNLTDPILDLFEKYKTRVSVSCDGPPHLNVLRSPNPASAKATAHYNEKLRQNLSRLCARKIPVGVISVLHRENASTPEKLHDLKVWLGELAELGITRGRANPMYADGPNRRFQLTEAELSRAWRDLFDCVVEKRLDWLPFREMVDNLLGLSLGPCWFGGCDVSDTILVSIQADGSRGNCDRTFARGVTARKPGTETATRRDLLAATECNGCRYWKVCQGGCPMEAPEGDWRRKTRFCQAILEIYSHIEKRLKDLMPHVRLVADGPGTGVVAARPGRKGPKQPPGPAAAGDPGAR
ncbi:MAG: radical SAM protein [Planctomycetes bacterium]|nr:radical SAM protein [Planctomycetota bacterium]